MPVGPEPMRRARIFGLAAALIFSLAMADFSIAGEGPAASSAPATEPAPTATPALPATPAPAAAPEPATEPAPSAASAPAIAPSPTATPATKEPNPPAPGPPSRSFFESFAKAIDLTHARIERNILAQVLRLDDFLGKEKTGTLRETGYEIRWRNSFKFEHGGTWKYGGSALVNLTLSKISNRLNLLFIGEDEPEPITLSLPQDPGNPGYDRTIPTTHFANTELRYDLIKKPLLNAFLGAGVRITSPPEAFGRVRLKKIFKLGESSLLFFDETLFANSTSHLGETTELAFIWQPISKTIINWGNSGTFSQKIRGLEWGSVLSMMHEISPRSAITVSTGAFGNTSLSPLAINYQITACYRQNFLRSWLFYEVQPEISWPRNIFGKYPATLAVTLRLEIVFKGSTIRKMLASGDVSPESQYP